MPEEKRLSTINLERYNALWEKIPRKHRDDWTLPLLQKHLEPWEFAFILASMHEGVSQNGGGLHGFCCFFEDLDAVIAAWSEIGAVQIAEYLRLLRERAIALGSMSENGPMSPDDGLPQERYEELDAYGETLPIENDETVERLFDEYWRSWEASSAAFPPRQESRD